MYVMPRVVFVPYFFIETDNGTIRNDLVSYLKGESCGRDFNMSKTDIETIAKIDAMVKDKLRLPYDMGEYVHKDKYEITTMDAIKQLQDENIPDDSYIESVIVSKIDKPYKIVVHDLVLVVVLYNGFFNLLLSNSESAKRFITTDVIREYANKFGKEELYSSPLFKYYVKNLPIL